jgi:hypothetical protein
LDLSLTTESIDLTLQSPSIDVTLQTPVIDVTLAGSTNLDVSIVDAGTIDLALDERPINVVIGETSEINLEFVTAISDFLSLPDTPDTYAGQANKILAVNANEDGVEFVTQAVPVDEFIELTDTPSTYSGQASKVLAVKGTEDGVEFVTPQAVPETFTDLTDTPSAYTGQASKILAVKGTEDGVEFIAVPTTAPGGSTGQVQYNNAGAFGGAANLYWDAANNRVGINNAAPAYSLDVTGNGNFTTGLNVGNTYTLSGVSPYAYIESSSANGLPRIHFRTTATNRFTVGVNGPDNSFHITGGSFAPASASRISITSAGKVGIGVATALTNLHVLAGASSGFAPGDTINGLFVENNGTSNAYFALQVATTGGGRSFTVSNAGNVGIGASPTNEKCYVYRTGTNLATYSAGAAVLLGAAMTSSFGGEIYAQSAAINVINGNTGNWGGNGLQGQSGPVAYIGKVELRASSVSYRVDQTSTFVAQSEAAATTTVTSWTGYRVQNPIGSGTYTNAYGLYVANLIKATNNYGVYLQAAKNYMSGYLEVGNYIQTNTSYRYPSINTLMADYSSLYYPYSSSQTFAQYDEYYGWTSLYWPNGTMMYDGSSSTIYDVNGIEMNMSLYVKYSYAEADIDMNGYSVNNVSNFAFSDGSYFYMDAGVLYFYNAGDSTTYTVNMTAV